jgi:hypothetical protein
MTRISRRLILSGALAALPACAAHALQDQAAYVRAVQVAKERRDYSGVERICRAAIAAGVGNEYLLRTLSWAQRKQGNVLGSLETARANWDRYPGVPSLMNLVEAARDAGDFPSARQAATVLSSHRPQWGRYAEACVAAIDSVASHTWEFTWNLTVQGAPGQPRRIPIPQQDPVIQRSVSYDVLGAESHTEKLTVDGVKYLEAVHRPGIPITLRARVSFTPMSWRPRLGQVTEPAMPSPAMAPFLGQTVERLRSSRAELDGQPSEKVWIDPSGPNAQRLIRQLRGANPVATVENVMNYVTHRIPWTVVPENPQMTSERCIALERGSCTPRSYAAVALLRAAGIPARAIRGHSRVARGFRNPAAHTIPQFHLTGLGWVDSDFDRPIWEPPSNFLRMYYRVASDHGFLNDAMDPEKHCVLRHVAMSLD